MYVAAANKVVRKQKRKRRSGEAEEAAKKPLSRRNDSLQGIQSSREILDSSRPFHFLPPCCV